MLRPKKLGLVGYMSILAGGLLVISNLAFINNVSAQSPYATPSIESYGFAHNCITDRGDYVATDNTVIASKCNGHYGQYWQYNAHTLQITFQHNQSFCLTLMDHSTKVNTPAVIGSCDATGAFWNLYEGGYRNRLSGLCLTSLKPDDILRLEACRDKPGQKWSDPNYFINLNLCGNLVTANATQAQCIGLDLMQIYPYFWNPYQPVTLTDSQQTSQWQCLVSLWDKESSWGRTEGSVYHAYGIPQADPGITDYVGAFSNALPPTNSAITQIKWGLAYISERYGSPCGAWDHEIAYNWYVVNTQAD